MGWMLRAASILRRCVRDEAALCQTERSRREFGASVGGALGDQGARDRLPADGFGHTREYDGRPSAVSLVGILQNRTLLLQSGCRSVFYGTGSGNCAVQRTPPMKHLGRSMRLMACGCVLAG